MRWNGLLAATIIALLTVAAPAAAETFVVNTTADASGTCTTTCSIRQAVVSSGENSEPDTIRIPAGTYRLSQGPLQITSEVTIAGAAADATLIQAAPDSRVFDIAGTTASISHLTLAGGRATVASGYFGGNLRAQSSTVVLDHLRVLDGVAASGGGVANRNGTMTIQNSLLASNQANLPNEGNDGGAIVNFGGDFGAAAHLTIRDSTIAHNTAKNSGAISQWGNAGDTVALESVTVGFNHADAFTGGINPGPGTISVQGSLLAGNTIGTVNSNCVTTGIVSLGHNVDDGAACGFSGGGDVSGTAANLDPELRNEGGGTEVLVFNKPSPALEIGGTCSPTDQIGQRRAGDCDAGAWELPFAFTFAPDGPSNRPPAFTWTGPYATYNCSIDEAQIGGTCTSPYTAPQLPDGTYTLVVEAPDDARIIHAFRIDATAPDAPTISDQNAFTGEAGATFECSLDGAAFAACVSPYDTAGVGPGDHVLAVRAVDLAGNRGAASTRAFTVGSQPPVQTPVPTATPAPTATPGPEPVRNRSVEATPSGTVLIKDATGRFVPLVPGVVPNGSELDAKDGAVTITTSKGETATFSAGRFKISQQGDVTTATLSEPLDCPKAKGKASAAAKQPKTRKLWGDGKGRFKTKGSYSAATVRGTRWLVQDTCTTTLTRVTQGVVSVRDDAKKKSFTLRKGKSYTARAKKK